LALKFQRDGGKQLPRHHAEYRTAIPDAPAILMRGLNAALR